MSRTIGPFLDDSHSSVQHPPAAPHRSDGARGEHAAHADEQGVTAPCALIGQADPSRQLATADDLAGVCGEDE